MRRSKQDWLELFQQIASKHGGKCISDAYMNQSTRLEFACRRGHLFSAMPVNVFHHQSWCPHCSGNAKLSIADAHEAAAALGGKCLSSEYVGVHKPLRWQCSKGHKFSASLTSVRTLKAFCMECQKLTIEEFQWLTKSIGYTLLSDTYVNNYPEIRVLCDVGHLWYVPPRQLKKGQRCPECKNGSH